ncbi:MAG TPA: alanine acetyltransferase, partial [Pseudoalteromonas sp.]|nr:alanine acetyltransferase [Pseudoalteromonas sp.]
NWVTPHIQKNDKQFDEYPDESIAAWHQRLNLEQ